MRALLLVVLLLMAVPLQAQGISPASGDLAGISANGRTELVLRLRNHDTSFRRITFYDRNNTDLVFDTIPLENKKWFKRAIRALHPGALYRVIFEATGRDSRGLLQGDLIDFTPLFYDKLP
jgi:hypothetical protein